MRRGLILLGFGVALGAMAAFAEPAPTRTTFHIDRGSAPPPPIAAPTGQAAPPEGVGPGGIDFGHWKTGDAEVISAAFETHIRARFAGRDGAAARPDLEANGFHCESGAAALQCRIEISEGPCAKDWYVVFEQARTEPLAGFDVMCLARR